VLCLCSKSPHTPATRPDVRIAERAADSWGVLSVTELLACGLSRDGVSDRVIAGRLHRKYAGVYAVGHPNVPLEGEFLAAVKACGPGALLSHYAAAALYGLVKWDDRRIDVTVPGTSHRKHDGIRVHRTTTLDPTERRREQGVPTTSPARALLDLAATSGPRSLRRAVRQALATHKVNLRELADVLQRNPHRRGARKLATIVATGHVPTRSELEDVVLDLILNGGLTHPDVNEPMTIEGRKVIPDFRWPAQRLVVEADSRTWHDDPIARQDDAERQALLEAHGERVVRVTWAQAVTKPTQTLARLRKAGARSPGYPLAS
jgi:very-short-patch-repair endonuclease/predicted transcriptional regulator of viral defense system